MPSHSPFILEPEILETVQFSPVTLYREEKAGRFPRKVKLSPRKNAWLRADFEAWSKDPEGWRARHAPQQGEVA